jgi:uncharacterized protein (TIGR00725 family)
LQSHSHPIAHPPKVGRLLVDAGCRVATGGLGGVMERASAGAASSPSHADGDVLALLPGVDASEANRWASVVLPTGLGDHRNGVVALADAMVVVGGGAGSLVEFAAAWSARREPLVVVDAAGLTGAPARFVGERLDARGGAERPPVLGAESAAGAVRAVVEGLRGAGWELRRLEGVGA